MNIGVVGVNYLCPIEDREKVFFTLTQKLELITSLKEKGVEEVIILSTCNRSEIYIADNQLEKKIDLLKIVYKNLLGEAKNEVHLFYKQGRQAVEHLYQVTAGLDSLVLGEDQILGQVKAAWELSMEASASGKLLNKVFREAISTAKTIKCTLKISENPTSIGYVAIKFLKKQLGNLEGKRILVIGAGNMGKLVMTYLQEEKVGTLYVSNRTHGKATLLGEDFDKAIVIPYEKRYDLFSQVDAVICATASPHIVLKAKEMPPITQPICMIDIALPRDIDPLLGEQERVTLYDIDSLKEIAEQSNENRKRLASEAKDLIDEKICELLEWIEYSDVDYTIGLLEEKRNAIEQNTLAYIHKKGKLSQADQKLIDKMVAQALKKFVKLPATNLKKIQNKKQREAYTKMIAILFELEEKEEQTYGR